MIQPTHRTIALFGFILCLMSAVLLKTTESFAAAKPSTATSKSHSKSKSKNAATSKPQSQIKSADTRISTQAIANTRGINPQVLSLALKAHQKAQRMGVARKPLLTIIDYSLPSTKPRLWVMDVATKKIIYHTYVAHGKHTGENMAQRFSDKPGSLQSSLGVFVTGKTYHGKHGLSLTLHGLEKGINGNAARRAIVMHAAHYVNGSFASSRGRLGRSWGCPAVDARLAKPLINTIQDGSVLFAYYPDKHWLNKSTFLS